MKSNIVDKRIEKCEALKVNCIPELEIGEQSKQKHYHLPDRLKHLSSLAAAWMSHRIPVLASCSSFSCCSFASLAAADSERNRNLGLLKSPQFI